jgi:hypothetical protein
VIRPRPRPATRRLHLRDERGVVTVEFALLLPVILAVVFLIIDFGRVFNYVNDTNQIAANGARFAAVDNVPGGGSLQSYLAAQADTTELREGGSKSIDDAISVCVSFPNGTSNVGDPVKVSVESEFKVAGIITRLIPGGGDVTVPIHGEAVMRIERPPTAYSAGC